MKLFRNHLNWKEKVQIITTLFATLLPVMGAIACMGRAFSLDNGPFAIAGAIFFACYVAKLFYIRILIRDQQEQNKKSSESE